MCFGGGSPSFTPAAQPKVEAAPAPAPLPSATPTRIEAQGSQAARRRRTSRVRAGFQSTIKTSAQGITGKGSGLVPTTGKKATLG